MKTILLLSILALGSCSIQKRAHLGHRKTSNAVSRHHNDSENQQLLREGVRLLHPLLPKLYKYAEEDHNANIFSRNDRTIQKKVEAKLLQEADTLLEPLRTRLHVVSRKMRKRVGQSRSLIDMPGRIFRDLVSLTKCVGKLFLPSVLKCFKDEISSDSEVTEIPTTSTIVTTTSITPTTESTAQSTTEPVDSPPNESEPITDAGYLTPATDPIESETAPFPQIAPPQLSKTELEKIPNTLIHVSPEDLKRIKKNKRHGKSRRH